MVRLVMLEDDELGREGDVVDVEPQTALDLIEAGVARMYMGQEEETPPHEQLPHPSERPE